MWNLIVFGTIGLLTGAASRLLYPGREPARILGTLLLGVLGALAGGMVSYSEWTPADGQFHSANLVLAFGGATLAIVIWAGLAYARSVSVSRRTSP